MASFNYYIKDKNAKKKTAIYLLFDDGVNNAKLYIQQSIDPKDWNANASEARRSLYAYAEFNAKLEQLKSKCIELYTALTKEGIFTIDTLREAFKDYINILNNRKQGETAKFKRVVDFADFYLDSIKATANPLTVKNKQQTVNVLKEYETVKHKLITFDGINLDFYTDFTEYLTTARHLMPNSIGKHIKELKAFLNEATERGYNTKADYKSKRFKVTNEPAETIYLTETEIKALIELDLTNGKKLDRARDLFIVGCYTGLRFADFSQLAVSNIQNDTIQIKTQKTGEVVSIPVHPYLKPILKKYSHTIKGLPQTIANANMNDYLKELGELAKINEPIQRTFVKAGLTVNKTYLKYELITTHTARRSFATNQYLSGFPSISIMKITGHRTEKAFMKYIKISQEENAELLRQHWAKQGFLKAV